MKVRLQLAFVFAGFLWAVLASAAAWASGARLEPLGVYNFLSSSAVPLLTCIVSIALAVNVSRKWQRRELSFGAVYLTCIALVIGDIAFVCICIEESSAHGYWTRMGERRLVEQCGGVEEIVRQSEAFLASVARGEARMSDDGFAKTKELAAFPALAAWKFEGCQVASDMHGVAFGLGNRNWLKVYEQGGLWMAERSPRGGFNEMAYAPQRAISKPTSQPSKP